MRPHPKIAIIGAGQIGTATYELLTDFLQSTEADKFGLPSAPFSSVELWDNSPLLVAGKGVLCDVQELSAALIATKLRIAGVTHVINALPFYLNVKLADAAFTAGCSYFDFTEDDAASDAVQSLYSERPDLVCATKCGLAPGFVNYIGYDLISRFTQPESLLVSVGALPSTVNFSEREPWKSYNLSWSVDGLVNEYIRPCRVKVRGRETQVPALSGRETLIIDGTTYELANTSGGVGSLTRDLKNVPNICYKTIRYPGHYDYVEDVVKRHHGNFDAIKEEFLRLFPFNKDDVIVVFAEATGRNAGLFYRTTFSGKFGGDPDLLLSGIQRTTAGGAIAVLELALRGKLQGVVRHADIKFEDFKSTLAFNRIFGDLFRS